MTIKVFELYYDRKLYFIKYFMRIYFLKYYLIYEYFFICMVRVTELIRRYRYYYMTKWNTHKDYGNN